MGVEGDVRNEFEEYGTFTEEFYRFCDWLIARRCPIGAMESTEYNLLEERIDLMIVNA
jgi:hypothetical protein